jgi:hypothetical protein
VFQRYAIVEEGMLREAGERLARLDLVHILAAEAGARGQRDLTQFPRLSERETGACRSLSRQDGGGLDPDEPFRIRQPHDDHRRRGGYGSWKYRRRTFRTVGR